MGHLNVAEQSLEKAEYEIRESFEILTQRLGNVKHFSWSYGRFDHFGPELVTTVFDTG